MNAPDANICSLCGQGNACAIQRGKPIEDCWCFRAVISQDVLERIPDERRGQSCICPSCAGVQNLGQDEARAT